MIQHTVVFSLKHEHDSQQEADFLSAAKKLMAISTVKNFKVLRQVSSKNNFDFGLSMEFSNDNDYQYYNNHTLHTHFVQQHWLPEVEHFMEIDYQAY